MGSRGHGARTPLLCSHCTDQTSCVCTPHMRRAGGPNPSTGWRRAKRPVSHPGGCCANGNLEIQRNESAPPGSLWRVPPSLSLPLSGDIRLGGGIQHSSRGSSNLKKSSFCPAPANTNSKGPITNFRPQKAIKTHNSHIFLTHIQREPQHYPRGFSVLNGRWYVIKQSILSTGSSSKPHEGIIRITSLLNKREFCDL